MSQDDRVPLVLFVLSLKTENSLEQHLIIKKDAAKIATPPNQNYLTTSISRMASKRLLLYDFAGECLLTIYRIEEVNATWQ